MDKKIFKAFLDVMMKEETIEWVVILAILLVSIHLIVVEKYDYGSPLLGAIVGYVTGSRKKSIIINLKKGKDVLDLHRRGRK